MIKVFEAFSGIGTQRMALRNIGVEHEVVAIAEIDKFAIKSYEAIHGETNNLGDISKIKTEDIPDHDLFTYSFPCFTGDTLVLTDDGYKRIDEINIGDKVLTHTNQYKKVTNVFNQGVKDIINVKGMAVHNIKTTENHKFLTRERHRVWNNDKRSYDRLFHEPQWVEAKDLTKDHYLGLSINQNSELPSWDGYTNSWGTGYGDRTYHTNFISPLLENNDFWWLMGRYVADGWHRKHGGIVIAVPDVKLEEFENRVNGLFDYNISKERTVNKVHIPIKELSLFTEQFGYYAHGKKISAEVLDLPVELLKSFIEGYFSGDGSYLEDSKLYKCTTTSEELVYGIGQCVAKVYHRPYSIYKDSRPATSVIEGRTVNQRDTYSLTFKMTTGKQDKAFYEDGHIWFPFNGLENDGKETVYDIEVEDDHSFTVFNTIAHNCQDISIAGKQKGFEKGGGTRSGLLWECEKVIRVKKPKYLLMENVKNLVSKKFLPGFEEWLQTLEDLGYTNYYQVLNAKDYGIPQNRERVFCVSILGDHEPYEFPEKEELTVRLKDVLEDDVDEKFYLSEEKTKDLTWNLGKQDKDIKVLTNTSRTGYRSQDVHGVDGISPTITARDYKGAKQVAEPKVDRIGGIFDKEGSTHQAGSVYDKEQLAPTLDTMQGGWRQPSILVKNATKKGYAEAKDGDGIDLSYPNSKTRRGRVQKDTSQTIVTDDSKGVVIGASRGRNPENPSDRTAGAPTRQRLELNKQGTSNTITTVQKDNYVVEVIKSQPDFYCKGNVLIDSVTLGERFDGVLPFEVDYTYTSPKVKSYGDYVVIISQDDSQFELIEPLGNMWVSIYVGHDLSEIEAIPKEEFGRMGRQAVETFNENFGNHSDTINPFNKPVSSSNGISPTLTTRPEGFKTAVLPISKDLRIRKLTPKECWRLMGCSDEDFEKAQEVNSNTQLYKQAGNAIVVDVLEKMFEKLFSEVF